MKTPTESYFYYPSTVVLVDDNQEFIDNLDLILKSNDHKLEKTFLQPQEALLYLKKQNYIYNNYQSFLEAINAVELDADDRDLISKINFKRVFDLIYNKERFDEVSVIVVDYFMPGMNGLEFFEKIKDIPSKKVLLTGNNDYQLAVDAFNQGLIDRFILKEDGMEEKIVDSVAELKGKYFQGFSTALLQAFNKGIKKTNRYMAVLTEWNDKNKIKEYYQCDGSGSCVGFDNNGEIHWLLIASENEILSYIDVIDEEQDNPKAIKSLKSKEKMLFFLTEEEKQQNNLDWNKYMFKISGSFTIGKEKYFYSHVQKQLIGIDTKNIVTWNDSLKT